MKVITFTRGDFTEKRQGFSYNDLEEKAKQKVLQDQLTFLMETTELEEDEEEPEYSTEYLIESIEINDYLFDEDGELLPITTHVGKNNEVLKHTWSKKEYPCEISESLA